MANELFRSQLASYASVHRNWRNKATHFVGIPLIVFSLLLLLSLWRFEVGDREWTLSLAAAIVAVLGWMALDLGIGIVMGLIMVVAWCAAHALAAALGSTQAVWIAFLALFAAGWILQFLGHHYEGKRPALVDNIFQGFIGPMFLVAETMVMMGRRTDLAEAMGDIDVTVE
ncbi:MAG: DUF962 domain-containing protein [Reyranella sp.]|nr:DUF962 domain-containing protein [Reyranella sp.]MBL6651578.1 DUF962 domain-containing protein [Reyranella sp.]